MARNTTAQSPPGNPVASYKYPSKRKNIPPAGLAAQGTLQDAPKLRYEYNPHLPPTLRSAPDAAEADRLPEYLEVSRKRALTDSEARTLATALRKHEPWLEWSSKREKPWFEVEPVALHIHERVSTQAILRMLARQDVQRDLFADPQQSYAEAVQFYKYDVDWANRLILGDSLQVMASLARREDLTGKVQMIYFRPAIWHQIQFQLSAAAWPARRERPRARPYPGARNGQPPRHLDAWYPFLSLPTALTGSRWQKNFLQTREAFLCRSVTRTSIVSDA